MGEDREADTREQVAVAQISHAQYTHRVRTDIDRKSINDRKSIRTGRDTRAHMQSTALTEQYNYNPIRRLERLLVYSW